MDKREISGYRYGAMYWFGVLKSGRISGLSHTSFEDEDALLRSYDSAGAGVGLWRVYDDGEKEVIREPR